MELSLDVYEKRRKNLLALIEQKYEGNRSNFARQVGKNVNTINLYLSSNQSLRRNIGERNARELEAAASMPSGWLDQDAGGYEDRNSVTSIDRISGAARDPIDVPGPSLLINSKWIRTRYPDVDEAQLGFISIVDDEMAPAFSKYDVCIINKSEKDPNRSGVYLVKIGSELKIRRLQMLPNGDLLISCDNKSYQSITLSPNEHNTLKITGRVRGKFVYVDV